MFLYGGLQLRVWDTAKLVVITCGRQNNVGADLRVCPGAIEMRLSGTGAAHACLPRRNRDAPFRNRGRTRRSAPAQSRYVSPEPGPTRRSAPTMTCPAIKDQFCR